jgi:hypothetical protein
VTVPPKRPEPTFKEIIQAIKQIIDRGGGLGDRKVERQNHEVEEPAPKPRRGLSPGLLLMAVVALIITIAAAVKNMK